MLGGGISQSPQEVTATCAKNIAAGQTAVGRGGGSLCGLSDPVYDVGINTRETLCNVIDEKVAHGTRDFYKEPAMDETQMRQALQCGLDAVYACKCDNLDCLHRGGHRDEMSQPLFTKTARS